jgi:Domain of unknown function (DUF5666)
MVISSRVSRCAAVTVAVCAAASLAACGSSSTPSASSSSTAAPAATSSSAASNSSPTAPAPAAAAAGKDRTFGLVASVSGGTVMVTGPKGPATVDVTPSTHVTQLTAAQFSDVVAGECVAVHPTRGKGTASSVTAAAVLVTQAGNGRCGRAGARGVGGTVASVNGSSMVLTAADNSQITVTVTPGTRYAKRSTADTSAIAAGQCLMARGTKDGSGNLAATAVNLRPADNGQCGGGRRHGG